MITKSIGRKGKKKMAGNQKIHNHRVMVTAPEFSSVTY
jgi:hypothetical protein